MEDSSDKVSRWQDDIAFCDFLVKMSYASIDKNNRIKPAISAGLVIYMWETWQAARLYERRNMGSAIYSSASL